MLRSVARTFFYCVVLAFISRDASAQNAPAQAPPETVSTSGPRVGITYLSDDVRHTLVEEDSIDVGPVISQFGWQWERRFLSSSTGWTGVTEWVLLFGGLDQGVALPSLSWLVGLRTVKGVEFALGPNITPVGVGLAGAAGVTFRAGSLNVPVNLAVVPTKAGVRVSLLAGFNSRRH